MPSASKGRFAAGKGRGSTSKAGGLGGSSNLLEAEAGLAAEPGLVAEPGLLVEPGLVAEPGLLAEPGLVFQRCGVAGKRSDVCQAWLELLGSQDVTGAFLLLACIVAKDMVLTQVLQVCGPLPPR
mmetsp:Transcript_4593/g.8255  ORF Transcript_4593/g.8255 Transcript_4593/m.8255 type:complete len:125 (-) Transcript_4593:106-480(-)